MTILVPELGILAILVVLLLYTTILGLIVYYSVSVLRVFFRVLARLRFPLMLSSVAKILRRCARGLMRRAPQALRWIRLRITSIVRLMSRSLLRLRRK